MSDVPILKELIQKVIDDIKEKLQEYWVNELHLPIDIQCKSMAIMDLHIDNIKFDFEDKKE